MSLEAASGVFNTTQAGTCPSFETVNGTLSAADPTTPRRLTRDEIASTCAGKPFPGIFSITGNYVYDVFGPDIVEPGGTCVTVHFSPGSCGENAHPMAYMNSFDPNNFSQNYLGYPGPSNSQPFSFFVPGVRRSSSWSRTPRLF